MTLGSLFDGIGGWLLAVRHAGVTPVWASEIEPFPCSVTARHFPDVKQLGDITQIDLDTLTPVDIICAGSPCQDLSIAGKRKGLDGERSGLFRTAVDLVRRMRIRTGGRYPRFFVWENVPGAFSSNKGADFRAVLEEIGQTEIPIPQHGKWANAGMVECDECQIAWRVLDAQYWGVPQRRRRIFLVADFAADDRRAGEILFEREGMSWNPAESKGAGEGASRGTEKCSQVASGVYGFDTKASIANSAPVISDGVPPITTNNRLGVYDMTHADEVMHPVKDGIVPTLNARMGTGGNQVPVVHAYCRASGGKHGGGSENLVMCVGNGQVDQARLQKKVGALNCMHDQQIILIEKAVRRLTPTECERLQGLPDGYTEGGSDTARYKALGNGMAQPCADYVIRRIVEETKEA
jgi:DNA (cytosine-5-)-methyltransferase